MCKSARFEWTTECKTAFEKIKKYLANPPCLNRQTAEETLVLYLATTGFAVSAALVKEDGRDQKMIYFVSYVLRDAEIRYTQIENAAYALKALANFDSSGRLLSWALEISEFDITFHFQSAQNSQIFAYFIADYSGTPTEVAGKWTLYVDGASSLQGAGTGVSLIGPQRETLNYALHFQFLVTNNIAKYEAMIAGLKLTKGLGAREVSLHSGSELDVQQINAECRVMDDKLIKYHQHIQLLKEHFTKVEIQHLSRNKNSQADALYKLGAAGNLDKERPVIVMDVSESSIVNTIAGIFAMKEVDGT